MKNIIIFGNGKYAEIAYQYIKNDSEYEICAFTADLEYIKNDSFLDLPLIPFNKIDKNFKPKSYLFFIATGYQNLNRLRTQKYVEASKKGYKFISYISSKASNIGNSPIGENCFILENSVIQPGARIGNNVTIWSNNIIGHHSKIEDNCYIAGNCIIGGNTIVNNNCFIGINATIGHNITVEKECIIGAGSIITKNTEINSVYIEKNTPKYRIPSDLFIKMTKL